MPRRKNQNKTEHAADTVEQRLERIESGLKQISSFAMRASADQLLFAQVCSSIHQAIALLADPNIDDETVIRIKIPAPLFDDDMVSQSADHFMNINRFIENEVGELKERPDWRWNDGLVEFTKDEFDDDD